MDALISPGMVAFEGFRFDVDLRRLLRLDTKGVWVPVAASFDAIVGRCDAVMITDLQRTAELIEQANALFGPERVLTPNLILPPPRVPNGVKS